jgi:hypothetical protein
MIHRAKVQYSNSATGEIQVIIPSVTSKTGVVPITLWGRKSHAANSKWLVPAVGDTIVVCREDEDYTNVFWLNTTVPPDPPYTFNDAGDTQFGTDLAISRTYGGVSVGTLSPTLTVALTIQPPTASGYGIKINPTSEEGSNRASLVFGTNLQMMTGGTGGGGETIDWGLYDDSVNKWLFYHNGHGADNASLQIAATGTHTTPSGTFTRNLWIQPTADISGSEFMRFISDCDPARPMYFNRHVQLGGSIYPAADGTRYCGYSGNRWNTVYATNGSINTSDQNEKTDIADSDLGLDFINALRPVSFKWIDRGGGEAGVRTHYGLLGQEVESVLGAAAPTTALWTKSAIPASAAIEETYNDNGTIEMEGKAAVEAHDLQGLRYEELISPMIKAIQELTTRLTALESA